MQYCIMHQLLRKLYLKTVHMNELQYDFNFNSSYTFYDLDTLNLLFMNVNCKYVYISWHLACEWSFMTETCQDFNYI
jgi:hypothetical protein